MCGIIGLVQGDRLTLWRIVGGRAIFFAEVTGSAAKLSRALAYARELDVLAAGLGGWAKVLSLGFDPPKPRQPVKVVPGILAEDHLDGRLGKL